MRRIDRELDIARFVRNQILLSGIIKALTTRDQRQIAKRRYALILNKKSDPKTTEDTHSDVDITIYPPIDRFEHNLQSQMNKAESKKSKVIE